MAERLGAQLKEGATIHAGELVLSVRSLVDGRVDVLEVAIPAVSGVDDAADELDEGYPHADEANPS